jgi:uncharacterized repeat protein (TIGR03803 family)
MSKLAFRVAISLVVLCTARAPCSFAFDFTTLVSFDPANGSPGVGPLVQGLNGNFYGTTGNGGPIPPGTFAGIVFEMTPTGQLTTVYAFLDKADGGYPVAGLTLATDGNFYGTAGNVFKVTTAGQLTTLHIFCQLTNCKDGAAPYAGLIQASDGNFYGTTENGGQYFIEGGTIFKITPGGIFTRLYSFCAEVNCSDGLNPFGGLVQASDGNFYGTTSNGNGKGGGTVFEISPGGKLTTLYRFCSQTNCADGGAPRAGLIQASDGNLFGTTSAGGTKHWGTVFEISPSGNLTTLYSFCSQTNCADGGFPNAGLVQATDGNFYGTTGYSGANGYGTIFEITSGGQFNTLHTFDGSDGALPETLMQATDGKLYGTTEIKGYFNQGTAFSIDLGLPPFVETVPTAGKTFLPIFILGNNLTGTTKVTFNGTPANFTVVSDTEIIAHIPCDTTTGKVQVTTPNGTLTSNVDFRVVSTISSFSPTSGPAGTSVVISGENLVGATSVTFGGVNSSLFTVNSPDKLTAIVPSGAATGQIGVTAPGGSPTSTTTFTVM